MSARSRVVVAVLFAFAVPAAVIVATPWLPGTSTIYHRWRMTTNYDKHLSQPIKHDPGSDLGYVDVGEFSERYEYHRQQLVRLGAVSEIHRTCTHLRSATDEGRHFVRLLMTRGDPPLIDFVSPYRTTPEPLELTIWCDAEVAPEWETFLEQYDVVDYRTRYLSTPPAP